MKKALLLIVLFVCFHAGFAQVNTYIAPKNDVLPVFDGDTTDNSWKFAQWKNIDQPWIPYNNILPSAFTTEAGTKTITGAADFSGRYKVLWSEADSLVLFLVEIHDDVFIDGYVPNASNYPNYDVIEIFIDENHSGGNHLFDSGSDNAENAFSYHMNVNAPTVGGITTSLTGAMDIYGNSYSNIINYKSHFPMYSMKNYGGGRYVYEFALRVYRDTYDNSNPFASRRALSLNDNMGLSIAYCDNDENDNMRNHFIGSVTVSGADNNNSYINASLFGTLLLKNQDYTAPTIPLNLTITNYNLSWSFSTDNVSVLGYNLYQNNVFLTSLTGLTYTLPGYTPPGSPYTYKVQAFDASGNSSGFSDSITYFTSKPELSILTESLNEDGFPIGGTFQFTISGMNLIDTLFISNTYLPCYHISDNNLTTTQGSNTFKIIPINKTLLPFVLYDISTGPCIENFDVCSVFLKQVTIYDTDTISIYSKYADTKKVSIQITHNWCISAISNPINDQCNIYPNPANDVLNIDLKNQATIIIANLLGNTILRTSLPEGHQTIDISNLKKGYYLLNVEQPNQPKFVKPIIKE